MKYRSVRRFLKVGAESLVTVEPLEVTDVTVQQIEALALVRPAKSGQFIWLSILCTSRVRPVVGTFFQ